MSTVRIQVRRGTEAQWALVNPILAAGEVGLESDTNYFKFGTGSTAWNALPYANEPLSDLENRVGAYLEDNLLGQPNGVASLNSSGKVPASQLDITELSQDAVNTAITTGTGISKSYDDAANTITISANTDVLATKMYAESYTDQAFAQIVGAAPSVLNTLEELSAALNDDQNFAATVTTALTGKADASVVQGALEDLDLKAPLNAPTFTGSVTLPSTTEIGDVTNNEIGYLSGVTSSIQVQLDDKAPLDGPIFTGSVTLPSTTSIGDVSNTELGYVNGVTSSIQVQLDDKAPLDGPIFTGSVTLPSTTSIGDVSNTEIGYVNGVTSSIQVQLDDKAPIESPTFTGTVGGITQGMVGLGSVDNTSDADKPISTATQSALDLKADAGDLTSHESATTTVHGIADTAALATKDYADAAVNTHNLDSTNVHGIADTSLLVTTTGSQTLSNKVLTTPTINGPTITDTGQTPTIHGIYLPAPHTIIFEGTTANDFEITLAAGDPTADRTITLPDATGTVQLRVADVSDTEIGHLNGVTSAIQTQLDAKAPIESPTFTGTVTSSNDLIIDGNLTVNGTTFNASATSITIEDNMVQLAHQNAGNTVDLGIVVAYNDGSAKHAGLVRDVSDNEWKLFKDVTDEPSTTVNFGQGSLDNLELNNLVAAGVVFTDGTQTKQGVPSLTSIVEKTAGFNITDANYRDQMLEVNHTGGSAVTITVTADGTNGITYPVGTSIDILRTNTGAVTIAGSGATVNATPGLTLRARWSSATLFKRAANTWVLMGDLTA